MNEKRKFISLFSLFLILVTVLVIMLGLTNSHDPTSTRYIKREKDEVKAYYSSLYFQATGEGSGISLENNVGYVTLDLKNYIDENVTKRDIEYQIKTVETYYNQNGQPETTLDGTKDLYVLDLWNQPTKIENNTCKYDISVESSNGEQTAEGNYLFKCEERGTSAVGKTHKATLKVERKSSFGNITNNEKISVVVQIIKPYKTIYIINMYVSNRLILFSDMDIELFETPFKSLQIQTANAFNYAHNNTAFKTSRAFKVTLSWTNLILNENMLRTIHNNVLDLLGTTIDENNLDISKPYIASLSQDTNFGTLVIYVPQSSNFNLNFLPTSNDFNIKVTAEIYHDKGYKKYTQAFGGYKELDVTNGGVIEVMKGSISEGGNANG